MYREWLGKMLRGAPRGTKTRLAEHLGLSGDMVSKMLSGVRDITADELHQISVFFSVVPPGFDPPIKTEANILQILSRVEGLRAGDVTVLLSAIQGFRRANSEQSSPDQPDDQSEPSTLHHEATPSR